eukprot:9497064-Pyramimonas_sp.AAC.1
MFGQLTQNQVTRSMADEFCRLQLVHVSDTDPFPRMGYQPAPDALMNHPPPRLHDIHQTMQAGARAAEDAGRAATDRAARRIQRLINNAQRG